MAITSGERIYTRYGLRRILELHPADVLQPDIGNTGGILDTRIPNFLIQELYPYRIPEHFALVDHAPELDVRNGYVPISDRPGLGVGLVEDRVRPYLWAKV